MRRADAIRPTAVRPSEYVEEPPKPPSEWFLHVFKVCGRANWIRAAAACRPRPERAAILELSVLDERIDAFPCAVPGCDKPRGGALCNAHKRQAHRRGGFRHLTPLLLPTRSPAAIEARRIARDAERKPAKIPAGLRTDEPCQRCGTISWSVSEYRKPDRPAPTIVRKCLECKRKRHRLARLSIAMPATGNMREVIA